MAVSTIHSSRSDRAAFFFSFFKNKERAYSLMEFVIVSGIVIILTGIAVASYDSYSDRARARVYKNNRRVIREAIFDYYTDKSQYPATLSTLTEAVGDTGRGYLLVVPDNPFNNGPVWTIIDHPDGITPGVYDIE
jgi:type II secretory pathway pseudopilin PulG